MTIESAREISSNPKLRKRLAKYLAQQCFRNTTLEDPMSALLRTRRPGTTLPRRRKPKAWSSVETRPEDGRLSNPAAKMIGDIKGALNPVQRKSPPTVRIY
jgi:hypothetical protein